MEISHCYHIPYAGGTNKAGTKVYIDKNLPTKLKVGNKTINPINYIALHEKTEKPLMDKGLSYQAAHIHATHAERNAVESDGINWDQYQRALQPYIHYDEHSGTKDEPKDLETKPYRDSRQSYLLSKALRR